MKLPIFIIYELIIRLQEFHENIGDYEMHYYSDYGLTIKTSSGSININKEIVDKQLLDPSLVSKDELILLANSFSKKQQ